MNIFERLKKAEKEKEEYSLKNKEYLAPESGNYTPNVCGRKNSRIKLMDEKMEKYIKLCNKVKYIQEKIDNREAAIVWKDGKEDRDFIDNFKLKVGTEIRTTYNGRSAVIVSVYNKSYKIMFEDGEKITDKIKIINRFNKDLII
jgi:hypothetical protein